MAERMARACQFQLTKVLDVNSWICLSWAFPRYLYFRTEPRLVLQFGPLLRGRQCL
jgi:hypothetical protein